MQAYIIRRLLLMVLTLLLATMIIFAILRLIPGNVIDLMVAQMSSTAGLEQELTSDYLKHLMGMDVPVWVQYGRWLSGVVHGDLGTSLWGPMNVSQELIRRLPVSFELGVLAMITALIIALPIGVYSAIRQDTPGDYIGRTVAILAISLPSFWLGTMVVVYPSIYWGWSPPIMYIPFAKDPIGNIGQFMLPAIILGMILSGTTMRMTRTMMLEVLRQDYIRTAWSKGLRERTVVLRHALKNALIPVVTIIGLQIPVIIGGSVVLEQIFSLPGIGLMLIDAIRKRDYPVISGVNLLLASGVLVINLVVDLTYAWLDPRIQYR